MAYEHYRCDAAVLPLEGLANLCTDIGLLPYKLSFAQVD
jgi:hypothetical protein